MNPLGHRIALEKVRFRQQYGTDVFPLDASGRAGVARKMRSRSLKPSESSFLPDGLANAADSDLRVFDATPADFADPKTGLPAWPAVGSVWRWHGVSYTLLAVHPGDDEIGGVLVTLLLFAYKTPPSSGASTETAAEVAAAPSTATPAGERREYWPAPQS